MEKSGLGCHLLPISVFPAPKLLLITSLVDVVTVPIHCNLDLDLLSESRPPSNIDPISPEFGGIAGFGLPALPEFWCLWSGGFPPSHNTSLRP